MIAGDRKDKEKVTRERRGREGHSETKVGDLRVKGEKRNLVVWYDDKKRSREQYKKRGKKGGKRRERDIPE